MRYSDVRDKIYTGDLVAIRGERGLHAALLRWLSSSPYSRVGIAVWVGAGAQQRLMLAEEHPKGDRLVPLSSYAMCDFDVFDVPRYTELSVDDALWSVLGRRRKPSVLERARFLVSRVFRIDIPAYNEFRYRDCQSLAGDVWLRAGWAPVCLPSIPLPGDVAYGQGVPPRFEVRAVDPWTC